MKKRGKYIPTSKRYWFVSKNKQTKSSMQHYVDIYQIKHSKWHVLEAISGASVIQQYCQTAENAVFHQKMLLTIHP